MRENIRTALIRAITESIRLIRDFSERFAEPHWTWTRNPNGGWNGSYEDRPSGFQVYLNTEQSMNEAAEDFWRLYREEYPEYGGMVGFRTTGRMSADRRPFVIPSSAVRELRRRYGSYDVPDTAVIGIVDEFADFLRNPVTRLRFSAQLINFRSNLERIELPGGLVIRRLDEREINEIYGGPITARNLALKNHFGILEYVIEGEFDEPKIIGDDPDPPQKENTVRQILDRAMLALRTFKEGRVGYDLIRFCSVRFCPWLMHGLTYGDLYVPFGVYEIAEDEILKLREHAQLVIGLKESAMVTACSRLADAETRSRPQDQIIDAVIGMESILLCGQNAELSYRFSMRYSSMFDRPEEKHRAYRVARDLYSLRSIIAHGDRIKKKTHRVGDEDDLTLEEAAKRATATLRQLIYRFLPSAVSAPYTNDPFWDRAIFGLPDPA